VYKYCNDAQHVQWWVMLPKWHLAAVLFCYCTAAQAAWHSFAVAANGTAYSISTAQPTMLAVTGGAKIPLFAYAQNLALSPDASALYMTVGGVCVMRLTGNGLRQELVAGQCPGQQLQPSLQQRDGPGTDYS
jgi:hypothetical protein